MAKKIEHNARSPLGRRNAIKDILAHDSIRNQEQLRDKLNEQGFVVTQATLSRDLVEMRAYKQPDANGSQCYVLPDSDDVLDSKEATPRALRRWCSEVLLSAECAQQILVLRTPAGAANLLGAALDKAQFSQVLGCVAGDDTIIVITKSATAARELAKLLIDLAEL